MVKQPSNKQVKQRKETSATARRRFPPTPRLSSPSNTPATYTVALELVCEALDGLRNHARSGRTGCAQRPRRLDFAPLRSRSKTGPRILVFGFVAQHRFHFIVGRPRTHVISRLDFGSRVYLRAQWELARSLAERRLLAERECLGR